ncbi:gp53-like domain-containing protein [Pseudomonas aeruginosa]|uniref:gp53-like domain-containing protein n=1 Tax=Pseudomonas aeruginosa TaxID=287 RepID=UPI000A9069CC|nr:hypothetical protein [Pseudomonas aeruginosa]
MATNEFLSFATGAGANVLSQADYDALTTRLSGFQSGTAKSAQVNKAIRQAAFIAAAMGQFAADNSGADSLDNGDLTAFINHFKLALQLFIGSAGYGIDTGTANAYAVAFSPAVTALSDGMVVKFKAQNANTGASTFNPNSLGAKPIVTSAGAALSPGMIPANGDVWLQYNSSIGTGCWVILAGQNFGNAAYATLIASQTDETPGRVLVNGAHGIGVQQHPIYTGDVNSIVSTRFDFVSNSCANIPVAEYGTLLTQSGDTAPEITATQTFITLSGEYFSRSSTLGVYGAWNTHFTSLNVSAFIQTLFDDPDGATAFATMGESHSFGANGWEKLPNGLIRQWGKAAVADDQFVAITFPTAFLNDCYSVVATVEVTGALTGTSTASALVGKVTTTGCSLGVSINNGTVLSGFVYWQAVGR